MSIAKYNNNSWNQENLKVKKPFSLFVLFIVVMVLVFPDLNLFQILIIWWWNTVQMVQNGTNVQMVQLQVRIPSDKIITFNILASFEHRLLHFSLFTKYLVHFFCLRYRPKWNYVYIVHLFDTINPLIKLDEGTRLVYRAQAVHRINLFLF